MVRGAVVSGMNWAKGIAPDKENREKDDFYPTPRDGIDALLRVESFTGAIWEHGYTGKPELNWL
jgi:hypothetical protein